ncbi:hypothetical protein AB0H42_20670 [Nocardia sp. NPDC050799]|uniref:hypothetical protein n=1 Tax=Nocardia sp. NPDC050799 TaxID=3154842 RepID=UPI0033EB7E78
MVASNSVIQLLLGAKRAVGDAVQTISRTLSGHVRNTYKEVDQGTEIFRSANRQATDRLVFTHALEDARNAELHGRFDTGPHGAFRMDGNSGALWNPMRPEPPYEMVERYREMYENTIRLPDRERRPALEEMWDQFRDYPVDFHKFDTLHRNLGELSEQLGARPEEVRIVMRHQLRELFANKDIAIRVTPQGLAGVLHHKRFVTAVEISHPDSNVVRSRIALHDDCFGYDRRGYPPELRPVSGYVRILGEQASGARDSDALAVYGDVQVVLKPEVLGRATACVGDAVTYSHYTRPSPLLKPDAWSYGIVPHGAADTEFGYRAPLGVLAGIDRKYDSADFLRHQYVEAQVHGGVKISDIDHVIFPGEPSGGLVEALSSVREGGIPWKILPLRPE